MSFVIASPDISDCAATDLAGISGGPYPTFPFTGFPAHSGHLGADGNPAMPG